MYAIQKLIGKNQGKRIRIFSSGLSVYMYPMSFDEFLLANNEDALTECGGNMSAAFDGKILVPYPIESSLSGVQKRVEENHELWYHRTFSVPAAWKNKNVVLNFGAVDWKADVWVNDIKVDVWTNHHIFNAYN